jgi:hypothetical protein
MGEEMDSMGSVTVEFSESVADQSLASIGVQENEKVSLRMMNEVIDAEAQTEKPLEGLLDSISQLRGSAELLGMKIMRTKKVIVNQPMQIVAPKPKKPKRKPRDWTRRRTCTRTGTRA